MKPKLLPANPVIYDALARSKLLGEMDRAFHDATGLWLRLIPNGEARERPTLGSRKNPFCALMASNAGVCAACAKVERELRLRLDRKLAPQKSCCFAGMMELAVPVIVGGKHVATLLGGQVLGRKAGHWQFDRVVRQVRKWGHPASSRQLKKTYLHTPVVSEKRLQGAQQLLSLLATQLAESAGRCLLSTKGHEPISVSRAKTFIQAHAEEGVTLSQTAAHVHVSRHHFCKIFKQATGMTFSEFVARVRVEKAKLLLGDLRWRIHEVAHNIGYNSISQFNRTFHRYAGSAPTRYRARLQIRAGLR